MVKRFLAALKLARQSLEYYDAADLADFWTPTDAAVAKSFFGREQGKKLRMRLRNMVFRSAVQACRSESNGDYERGKARGVQLVINAIEQHLALKEEKPAVEGEQPEAEAPARGF